MSQHDILVINQTTPLDLKYIDQLQRKGFSLISSNELSTFKNYIQTANEPILLVNCSGNKDIKDFIEEVCNAIFLQSYPVVILANDLAGLDSKLNKIFPLAIAVQQPADSNKIIEALRFVERNYRISDQGKDNLNNKDDSTQELENHELTKEDVDDSIQYSNELFSAVRDFQLSDCNLGGVDLPFILSGRAKKQPCSPTFPDTTTLKNACTGLLDQLKAPIRAALERTNILTLKILQPLKIEPEVLEIAKAASILYAQSFALSNRAYLIQDYSFRGAIVLRKEICSAIKDSALNLGGDLSNRDLSRIVATIGKIIGQEDGGGDDQLSVSASAVVAADLINRLCFEPLYWNANAAYRLLRRIRQGKIKHLHPAICCMVLKLLAEALTSHINMRIMAPKKSLEDIENLEKSIRVNEETIVDLPELTAGMKLSRPLLTEDGKAILAEDLVLDDDLIMRIWQLSAIRLLDKAVIKRIH